MLSPHTLYEEFKFWSIVVGGIWGIFRGVEWFKAIREKDLTNIQAGVASLHEELKAQTNHFVGAMQTNTEQIKELRQDFKVLTTAFIAPPNSAKSRVRAARRKK